MSAEEQSGLSAASRCMETTTLHVWPRDEGEEEEERDEEHDEETKEPQRSSSDESEESEAKPPPASAVRRKVSFADAFGLNLVSVKEFDSRAETGPKNLDRLLGVEGREGDEYYISCLFTVPSSEEELLSLLQQTKLDVESIELLPASTTIRGIIRVLNLAYHKTIYVRTTLDGWQSNFDLLAEYLPGSSDGQTDRFTFKLNLVPPFPAEGTWVEFCLRYESNKGTFWSSNGGMNYVLFCHHRGRRELKESDGEKERETEESNHKGKKSCLKSSRKWSNADLKSKGMSGDLSDPESCRSEGCEKERIQQKAGKESSQPPEEFRKTLMDRRNRRRAARLARVQDYFSQREPEVQLGYHPHRETTEGCLKVEMPASQLSTPMGLDASGVFQDTPPIVTYHQIPLLSVDWGRPTDPPSHSYTAEISGGKGLDGPKKQLKEEDSTLSSTDAWKAFLNGTDTSDTHANAVVQGCLLHIASIPSHPECDTSMPGEKMLPERLQDIGPSNTTEDASAYKLAEQGITAQELALVHPGSETQVRSSEISFSEEMSSLKISQHTDATESLNSRGRHVVTHKKCEAKAGSLGTEEEVKGDINEAAHNTLTFTGIRDEPFTIGHMGTEHPLERLMSTDEEKEPKLVTEDISEKDENAAQTKVKSSGSKSTEELILQVDSEEALQLGNQNKEIILISESLVLDQKELDTRTERTERKASTLGKQGKENTMCHASDTSGPFSSTESVRESELLIFSDPHKGLTFEDTLPRQDAIQTTADTAWGETLKGRIVGLESVKQGVNKEPSHISVQESMMLDKEELDARTEWTDREALKPKAKKETMSPNPDNERLVVMAEEIPSIVVDNIRADKESEGSTTNVTTQKEPNKVDEVILEKKSKTDTYQDFSIGNKSHKTHRTTNRCTGSPALYISSHASDTYGPPGLTEYTSDSKLLLFSGPYQGSKFEETFPRQDAVEMKVTSWSESSEELFVRLESVRQKGSEKPFQLEDQNSEIISMNESMGLDKEGLDTRIEYTDRDVSKPDGKEETTCHKPENERNMEMVEEMQSVVIDNNVADRESGVSSTTNMTTQKEPNETDEVTLGDTCQDFIIGQESHKTHRTTDLCTGSPTLFIYSQAKVTSGPFGFGEYVRDREHLLFSDPHKDLEFGETLPSHASDTSGPFGITESVRDKQSLLFKFEETLSRQDAVEMKMKTSWNESSEEPIIRLESGRQKGNEKPFQLENHNSEIISMNESMVLTKEELDARIEWTDRETSKLQGKEEIICCKPENQRLVERDEVIESVAVDINVADTESEMSSTTNVTILKEPHEADEVTLGRKEKSDTCQDFIIGKEPHNTHRTTDLCTGSQTLSIYSHASNTSGPTGSTECIRDNEPLLFSDAHEGFEFEETPLRQGAAQIKSSKEMIMRQESRKQGELGDPNTEVVSMSEGLILDEEELDGKGEWSDWKTAKQEGQEEATYPKPENERLIGVAEEIPSVVVDNRADREGLTTNVTTQKELREVDEVTLERRESIVELERGTQGGNKEPFHLEDQSEEMISMSESMVLDKDELRTRTEWTDREASKSERKEVEMYPNQENKRLMEMTEKAASVAVDISVTDRQSEICSTTKETAQKEPHEVHEAMLGINSTSDTCNKDFPTVQESHKPHRTIDICACTLTLSITSHSSDTESVNDSEPLLYSDPRKSSECSETLTQPAVQDLQELQEPGSEFPASLSSVPTPAVSTVSSRLTTWWAEFCSLGHISKALLYTVLFVIFITVYLHDLPIFLAIYLLSMCWWCGQGIKKQDTTADSVD